MLLVTVAGYQRAGEEVTWRGHYDPSWPTFQTYVTADLVTQIIANELLAT